VCVCFGEEVSAGFERRKRARESRTRPVRALSAATGDLDVAINNPVAAPKALAFEILKVRRGTPVRQELLGPDDRPADEYVCVRKLHAYSGEPFC
jgi:GntR family transcriptional regulator